LASFNITCNGLNGIILCDDDDEFVCSNITIVSILFNSWIIDDDDFLVDVRLDCNVLPHIVPSFSLVVASIKLEYALWIVLSNEFSFAGFISILSETTIEEVVKFSVNGLTTTFGKGSDVSGKSTLWIFDGSGVDDDDIGFEIVEVSPAISAP